MVAKLMCSGWFANERRYIECFGEEKKRWVNKILDKCNRCICTHCTVHRAELSSAVFIHSLFSILFFFCNRIASHCKRWTIFYSFALASSNFPYSNCVKAERKVHIFQFTMNRKRRNAKPPISKTNLSNGKWFE